MTCGTAVERQKTASDAKRIAKDVCVARRHRLAGRKSAGQRFRFLFHGRYQPTMSQLDRLTISPANRRNELFVSRIDGKPLMKTFSSTELCQADSSFPVH